MRTRVERLSVIPGNTGAARSHRPLRRDAVFAGLDWFVFFVADVQTGFGPFVAVYLTTQKWTQVDIGLVLTVGGLVALVGPDARRRAGRRRAVRAAGRRPRDRGHQRQRAHLCDLADFSGGAGCRQPACRGELRAGAGDRRHQPRPGRPCRHRRTARPQCPLRVDRQRPRRRGDGRMRLFLLGARGLHRHRAAARSRRCWRFARISPQRDRSRAGPWRRRRSAAPDTAAGRVLGSAAAAPAADLRRLHPAVPSRQRRDAAADGQRPDHALEPMGDRADRGLHRGAAARRRA